MCVYSLSREFSLSLHNCSCWLQLDKPLSNGQLLPILALVIVTFTLIEAAGAADYKPLKGETITPTIFICLSFTSQLFPLCLALLSRLSMYTDCTVPSNELMNSNTPYPYYTHFRLRQDTTGERQVLAEDEPCAAASGVLSHDGGNVLRVRAEPSPLRHFHHPLFGDWGGRLTAPLCKQPPGYK